MNREEVRFSPGSHHLLVYRTPYTSIPTVDEHGVAHDTSGPIDAPKGGTADWKIDGVVGGAQSADAPPVIDGLPPGVAFKLEGGTVVLMNTHYLNATSKPITVDARINLWTIPKEQVTQEAGVLFFYDPIIRLPPKSSGYAEMTCPVQADITVLNLQTHMHRRGVRGEASFSSVGSVTPEKIYQSDNWEAVPVKQFAPGMPMKAGSSISYHCNYKNDEDRTILQGLSTKDEMCVLVGVYYPKDAKTELCSVDGTFANTATAGTWAGAGGTASCMDSVGCMQAASGDDATYQCILSACPKVAKPFNDTFKCMQAATDPCTSGCAADADPQTCVQTCVQSACAAELTACGGSSCN